MFALREGSERRIVVSRAGGYPHLIVAPDLGRIDVAKSAPAQDIAVLPAAGQYLAHEDAIWRMKSLQSLNGILTGNAPTAILGTPALVKAQLPDLVEEVVLLHAPVGFLVSRENRLYIIGERCWCFRGDGEEIETIANEPPWQFDDFLNSNAVVTTTESTTPGTSKSQSISISKPPPTPGRDPFVARFAFASEVFGVLISASSPESSGVSDTVLYQLKVGGP